MRRMAAAIHGARERNHFRETTGCSWLSAGPAADRQRSNLPSGGCEGRALLRFRLRVEIPRDERETARTVYRSNSKIDSTAGQELERIRGRLRRPDATETRPGLRVGELVPHAPHGLDERRSRGVLFDSAAKPLHEGVHAADGHE